MALGSFHGAGVGAMVLLTGMTLPAWALDTVGETPLVNWRFQTDANGNPVFYAYDYYDHSQPVDVTRLVLNDHPSFLGYGYDLSCVGWTAWDVNQNRQNPTLISPQHYAGSTHSPIYYGTQYDGTVMSTAVVNFYTKNSTVIQGSRLGSQITINADASLGRLTADFKPADGLGYASILDLGEAKSGSYFINYANRPIQVYGWFAELGADQIVSHGISATDISFAGGTISISGDSGSPTFMVYHDQFSLVGTRWWPTGDMPWCIPGMIPAINAELAKEGFAAKVIAPPTRLWTGTAGNQTGTLGNWVINDQVNPTQALALPGTADSLGFISANANGQYAVALGGDQAAKALVFYGSDQDRALNRASDYAFTTGSSGFVIGTDAGDRLLLGQGGLLNEDTHTQTIQAAIQMTQGQHWSADKGDLTVNGSVNTNGYVLSVDGTQTTKILGGISGSGRITKENSGTLALAGNNTFTGDLWIRQGKLQLNGGSTTARILLDVDISVGMDVAGQHTISRIDTASGAAGGNINLLSGGRLTMDNSTNFAFGRLVQGGTSGQDVLVKQGIGTVTFTGSNTYLGRTVIQAGTLAITDIHGLGAGGAGNETVLTGTGSLWLPAGFQASDEILMLRSTQAKLVFTGSDNTWSGGLALGSVGNNTLGVAAGGSLTLGGIITGDDALAGYKTLRLSNSGTVNLNAQLKDGVGSGNRVKLSIGDGDGTTHFNTQGNLTGDVSIDRGTLSIHVDRPFENAYRIYLGDGDSNGSVNLALLAGGAYTIGNGIQVGTGNLSGQTTLGGTNPSGKALFTGDILFSGRKTLRLTAASGGEVEFRGEIRDTAAMPGTIRKVGNGLVRLSHDSGHMYRGHTYIEQGTLEIDSITGSATGTGTVTVATGSRLTGSGHIAGLLTLESGSTLSPGLSNGQETGLMELAGGLVFMAGSHLELTLGGTNRRDLLRLTGGTLTGSTGIGGVTLDLAWATGISAVSYQVVDWSAATLLGVESSDFQLGAALSGYDATWRLDSAGLWIDLTSSVGEVVNIPEPAGWMIWLIAAMAMKTIRRR